ncbi:MAG: glycogen debranching enzyme family protein [Planctomycetes bacterium]|nr:glycogen debranching enzyme family protein [Planctomycetota bacterium]
MRPLAFDLNAEWLESDGCGGFAMGSVGGWRTRRYHGLLAPALAPPSGRHVLVNGFDAFVETAAGRTPLSTQAYAPSVLAPLGWAVLQEFRNEPWPTWRFALPDGRSVVQELFAVHGMPWVVVGWRLEGAQNAARAARAARLIVRPFLSGRDAHALHQANDAFRFATDHEPARRGESRLRWRPYEALPAIASAANGAWRDEPHWYHRFRYAADAARGFDAEESLGSPGEFTFDLARGPAWWIVGQEQTAVRRDRRGRTTTVPLSPLLAKDGAAAAALRLRRAEEERRAALVPARSTRARGAVAAPLARAAAQFMVHGRGGMTVLAGYPWFTDWGRDSAIAVRGLCIATGRRDAALKVLSRWSQALVEGVLPNRFPDHGAPPEFGAADASLWFVVAVEELLAADARAPKRQRVVEPGARAQLLSACHSIVAAYASGTRHGIRVDGDGLLAVGVAADSERPGVAPTWMDARVDGRAVTPRVGKPVELQALWWNALTFLADTTAPGGRAVAPRGAAASPPLPFAKLAARCKRSFLARFWDDARGLLHDVVDVDHVAGTLHASVRPNQLFALGGLPRTLLSGPRARRLVDALALQLWTPRGVRTLAPDDPRYRGRYEGGPRERDAAYHQGSAWPWLLFPLADAWARSRGDRPAARHAAFERFLAPLATELERATVPHLPELADGDPPHDWRGCPMQAWSLAALLQAEASLALR